MIWWNGYHHNLLFRCVSADDSVCVYDIDSVCVYEFDCVCFHDFDFVSFGASRMISLQFLRRHILSMNAITDVNLISIFLTSTLIQSHVYVFVFNSTLYLLQDITATHTLLLCKHKGNSMVLWCISTAVSWSKGESILKRNYTKIMHGYIGTYVGLHLQFSLFKLINFYVDLCVGHQTERFKFVVSTALCLSRAQETEL